MICTVTVMSSLLAPRYASETSVNPPKSANEGHRSLRTRTFRPWSRPRPFTFGVLYWVTPLPFAGLPLLAGRQIRAATAFRIAGA